MTRSSRSRFAAVLLLVVGFAYGFASAKWKLFPYALLAKLGGSKDAAPTAVDPTAPITPMDTGWWVPDEDLTEEGVTADLGALGYSQTYGEADEDARYGVVVHDGERAQQGLNLIVSAHAPSAILADMDGATLHEWTFDYADIPAPPGFEAPSVFGTRYFRRAALLPNGELVAVYDRSGMVKLDRDSKLVWGLLGGYHHDLDVTADGSVWVLTQEIHVIPRVHPTVEIFEDFVTRVSPDGEVREQVSLLEAFENSTYASLLDTIDPEARGDVFHTNTLEVFEGELAHLSPLFEKGNVLVSIWGLDTVAIVDLEAVRVVWALTGLWHRQHEPQILANGNLLVFDNMGHGGRSKVVELDPFTQQVAWAYEGDEANDFYSALCGSSQRLANGNTLITESLSGRAFEVTPAGETVWRYASPFRVEANGKQGLAVLMEIVRLPSDAADWLAR